ncbi:unnamed protein product [Cunninghamella echinulata]
MVQNKLIFFYCIFVFIGLIHALPRPDTVNNGKLAPSLNKRLDCGPYEEDCGGYCCDPDDYCFLGVFCF